MANALADLQEMQFSANLARTYAGKTAAYIVYHRAVKLVKDQGVDPSSNVGKAMIVLLLESVSESIGNAAATTVLKKTMDMLYLAENPEIKKE